MNEQRGPIQEPAGKDEVSAAGVPAALFFGSIWPPSPW